MIEITEKFDLLKTVNECQLSELKKAGLNYNSATSLEFCRRVHNVEAAVIHTYQLTALASIREEDPQKASTHWKDMVDFCDSALNVLKELEDKHPGCGASEVYNVALDYRAQAHKRFIQNLEDSECQTMPEGLFPQMK
jgi:hypothetical protein